MPTNRYMCEIFVHNRCQFCGHLPTGSTLDIEIPRLCQILASPAGEQEVFRKRHCVSNVDKPPPPLTYARNVLYTCVYAPGDIIRPVLR